MMNVFRTAVIFTIFCFLSCKSQMGNRYQVKKIPLDKMEAGIDSIWMEVVSWDGDTTTLYQKKRNHYASALEEFYDTYRLEKSPLAEKALLFAYFIRFRNEDAEQIGGNFRAITNQVSPELWQAIYPIFSKVISQTAPPEEWIASLNDLASRTEAPLRKANIWLELGRWHFYKQDKATAGEYFSKITALPELMFLDPAPKQLNEAVSFQNQIDRLQVGLAAPAFCATDIDGLEQCVNAEAEKVFLLDFWATWCGPCRKDMPKLKSIYEKHKDRDDFQIIGISLDRKMDQLRDYLAKENLPWPQIFEGGDLKRKGKITLLYNGLSLPTYVVIDKNGVIQFNHDLRKQGREMEPVIDSLLNQ